MTLIRTRGLTRRFGTKNAVDGLDLEVKAGEIALLLGPNGAGKTTTLRMILGTLTPSAGDAEVAGFSTRTHPLDVKRVTGFLPEEWGLLDFLKGREYLELCADLRGLDRAESSSRIDMLLKRFELADAKGLVRAYSMGMKQRLGLAAALLHRPKVLLLDEPTANLDPPGARAVAEMLRAFRHGGGAVLLSTHLIGDAEKIADKVFVVREGRLIADGTTAEIARHGDGDLERAFFHLLGMHQEESWATLV